MVNFCASKVAFAVLVATSSSATVNSATVSNNVRKLQSGTCLSSTASLNAGLVDPTGLVTSALTSSAGCDGLSCDIDFLSIPGASGFSTDCENAGGAPYQYDLGGTCSAFGQEAGLSMNGVKFCVDDSVCDAQGVADIAAGGANSIIDVFENSLPLSGVNCEMSMEVKTESGFLIASGPVGSPGGLQLAPTPSPTPAPDSFTPDQAADEMGDFSRSAAPTSIVGGISHGAPYLLATAALLFVSGVTL